MSERSLLGCFRPCFLYESNFGIDCWYYHRICNCTWHKSDYCNSNSIFYWNSVLYTIIWCCERNCRQYSKITKEKASYKWDFPLYFSAFNVHDYCLYRITSKHSRLNRGFDITMKCTLRWDYITPGIPDELFERTEDVPITKEDVRALAISKLRLKQGYSVIDVGCGSGSITVEVCLQTKGGKVYSIDFDQKAVELTKKNLQKFGLKAEILMSKAQDILKILPKVDAIIIGGTGGDTEEIVCLGIDRLKKGGRIVIDTILIETMYK